jgi:phosphoesterase RecJ-like protein
MNDELNSLMDEAIEIIKNSNNIYMASHVDPDGDNIGSLLSMKLSLKKIGKNVNIIKVDNIPGDFKFLPSVDSITDQPFDKNVDLFIALDSGDMERLGVAKDFALCANNIINIDHHKTNTKFGNINIIDSKVSSTGELVYLLLKRMKIDIDEDIATCIYTAISSDTGSFMYDSTSSKTHLIAAELLNTGMNMNKVVVNLYQSRSLEKTKLFISALNKLEFFQEGKIGIVSITQEMLKKSNAKMEDSEGIVSFLRDTEGVEVAVIMKEIKEDEIKVSMRSKEYVDVSKICLLFSGGGHKRAAGCTIYDSLERSKSMILNEIYKSIEEK